MIQIALKKKMKAAIGEMQIEVDFKVKEREFIALYGASGAGKTSILRMIAGLLKPDKGILKIGKETWLDTTNKIDIKIQQRNIGFVFQDYGLFPNMTVRENLNYALQKQQYKNIINELIDIVELGDLQNQKPAKLSGGQQQRVALARAIVRKPKLLLLDEPLSALDVEMRAKLQDYLIKVHQEYNLTTILVSHDMQEIHKMADTSYQLDKGRILKENKNFISPDFKTEFTGEIIQIVREHKKLCKVIIKIGDNKIELKSNLSKMENKKEGDKINVSAILKI